MSTLTVRERVQAIQRLLGVSPDGLLGPVTLTRLEAVLARCLPGAPEPDAAAANLVVSKRGLDLIVSHEIGSEANYRRRLSNPIWPGGQSGVTIGIGYDLGHTSATQIEKDWRGRIADADLAKLLTVVGKKGEAGKQARASVRQVEVPFEAAKEVFYTSTLPRFAQITQRAYPGVERLPADAQAALLSLVYNRGASKSGGSRREMKAIEPLVKNGDLNGIAEQIRAMKRLWVGKGLPGLLRRRDEEAELAAHADRAYEAEELVRL
jgi:GH24 family phage-related lysozyme (muramidase)